MKTLLIPELTEMLRHQRFPVQAIWIQNECTFDIFHAFVWLWYFYCGPVTWMKLLFKPQPTFKAQNEQSFIAQGWESFLLKKAETAIFPSKKTKQTKQI